MRWREKYKGEEISFVPRKRKLAKRVILNVPQLSSLTYMSSLNQPTHEQLKRAYCVWVYVCIKGWPCVGLRHHALENEAAYKEKKSQRPVPRTAKEMWRPWQLLQTQDNAQNFWKVGWRPEHISFESQEAGRTLAGIWGTYKLNTHENISALMPCGCNCHMLKIKASWEA